MNVGHHVVAQAALVKIGAGEVNVVEVGAQLGELAVGDALDDVVVAEQPEFLFRLRQCQPQAPPGGKLSLRSPQLGHFLASLARYQRVVVDLEGTHRDLISPDESIQAAVSAQATPPLRTDASELFLWLFRAAVAAATPFCG